MKKHLARLAFIGSVATTGLIGLGGASSPASALPAGWSEGTMSNGDRILYDGHGNYVILHR